MISVESQSCGVPVIGVRDGGLIETVRHAESGLLIGPEADVGELCDAVQQLNESLSRSMSDVCQANAERFSYRSFTSALESVVRR